MYRKQRRNKCTPHGRSVLFYLAAVSPVHRRCIAAPRRCPPGPPLAQRRRRGQRRSMLMPLINLRNRFISPRRASRAAPQRKSTEKCIRTYDDRLSPGHLKNLTGASFRMWPTRIRFVNEQQPPLPLLSFFSFLSLQTFLSFSLSLSYFETCGLGSMQIIPVCRYTGILVNFQLRESEYSECKIIQNIKSSVLASIFNKFLLRLRFFNCVCKNSKFHNDPQRLFVASGIWQMLYGSVIEFETFATES